jgi:NADH:ubiquinone oxidoreductase subunit K
VDNFYFRLLGSLFSEDYFKVHFSFNIYLYVQVQRRNWIKIISGWTLLMTNLILEFASAVFDQLGYAPIGMVLAFVALLLATAELIYMARKEIMDLLPCFHRPSTSTSAP